MCSVDVCLPVSGFYKARDTHFLLQKSAALIDKWCVTACHGIRGVLEKGEHISYYGGESKTLLC